MPSESIPEFLSILRSSSNILVLSGAGLSAASGVPTFRGSGGLWRHYDATSLATPAAFAENQSRVWQFYHYRRELVLKTKPNPAHYVLARLSIPSILHTLPPLARLTHVTQNIDGLLVKAREEVQASISHSAANAEEEPSEIIEMHGKLYDVICTAHDCNYHETIYTSPICPALGGTENHTHASSSADGRPEPVVRRSDLPHCPSCSQMLRPDVVWFGEKPHRILDILKLADEADLCIIVGTSALVQPASKLGERVKSHGGKIAVFNLEATNLNHSDEADFFFLGPCEERLGEVFGLDGRP